MEKLLSTKMILTIICYSFVIQCMEQSKSDPSQPDSSGICWLALLPAEVQDTIAFHLTFKHEEKEDKFRERLKKYFEEKHRGERTLQKICFKGTEQYEIEKETVIKKYGMQSVAYDGARGGRARMSSWDIIYLSDFTKKDCLYTEQKNEVIQEINLSLNRKYLIVRTTDSTNDKDIAIHLIDLCTKTSKKIPLLGKIKPEKIQVSTIPELLCFINKGYSYTSWGDPEHPKYSLNNSISSIAVSNDGKKIALGSNRIIYFMEQNAQDKNVWDCKEKEINQEVFQKVDELQMDGNCPEFWHWTTPACIDFNNEGTLVGVAYNTKLRIGIPDKILVHEAGKKPHRSLWSYFRSNFICKDLQSSTLVILEK